MDIHPPLLMFKLVQLNALLNLTSIHNIHKFLYARQFSVAAIWIGTAYLIWYRSIDGNSVVSMKYDASSLCWVALPSAIWNPEILKNVKF